MITKLSEISQTIPVCCSKCKRELKVYKITNYSVNGFPIDSAEIETCKFCTNIINQKTEESMDNLERLITNQALEDYKKETKKVEAEIKLIIDKHLIKHGLNGEVVSLNISVNTFDNPKEFSQYVTFISSDKAKQIIINQAIERVWEKLKNMELK